MKISRLYPIPSNETEQMNEDRYCGMQIHIDVDVNHEFAIAKIIRRWHVLGECKHVFVQMKHDHDFAKVIRFVRGFKAHTHETLGDAKSRHAGIIKSVVFTTTEMWFVIEAAKLGHVLNKDIDETDTQIPPWTLNFRFF